MDYSKMTLTEIIELQRTCVGCEAFDLKNVANLFTRSFNEGIFSRLRTRTAAIFKSKKGHVKFPLKQLVSPKTFKLLETHTYVALRDSEIYVPKGFYNCSINEYIIVMAKANNQLNRLAEELITPVTNYMNVLLNNASLIASSTNLDLKMVQSPMLDIDVDRDSGDMSTFFDAINPSDTQPYGTAYRSNGDFIESVRDMLALQDQVNMYNPEMVEKAFSELLRVAEALLYEVKNNEEYKNVTPKVANTISKMLYHTAAWVEWYAIHRNQVLILSVAMDDTVKKFNTILA